MPAQGRTPAPRENEPRKRHPLFEKQASNEIDWAAERFRRNGLQAVTMTLERDGHDNAADSESACNQRQLGDGQKQGDGSAQEKWHGRDVDEQIRARLVIPRIASPLPSQQFAYAH